MNEKKYEFVEEVIRKKPSIWKMILSKLVSMMGLAIVFSIGVLVVLFVARDSLKEILFADEKIRPATNLTELSVRIDEGEHVCQQGDLAEIEENIDKSILTFYTEDNATGMDKIVCTGVILTVQDDVYALVPYEKIKNTYHITARFFDGTFADAYYWNHDAGLGMAILKVSCKDLAEETLENINCVTIINSNSYGKGHDFIYEGNAFGEQVLTYTGNIAGVCEVSEFYDTYCRIFYTDIMMDDVEDGFLFDFNGHLIGMVLDCMENIENTTISAAAVYDLSEFISAILGKEKIGYFGITGEYVDYEILKYVGQDIPQGVYITSVDNKSAAYNAGIMAGDVIIQIGDVKVDNMYEAGKIISCLRPGQATQILLQRKIGDDYKKVTVTVTIGERI